jgi:hypothetical protein
MEIEMNSITAVGYVATAHDLIWGTGATEEAARADMRAEIAKGFHADDDRAPKADDAEVLPASASLIDAVRHMGGDCGWFVRDGVACTRYEADAA